MEFEIIYSWYNTKVKNYLNKNKKELKELCKEINKNRIKKNLPIRRSFNSYYKELLAHQRMYKLHLFRKHTIDCDLEEQIKKWKEIIYFIFSL